MLRLLSLLALLAASASAADIEGKVVEDHSNSPVASASVRVFKIGVRAVAADLDTDGQGRFEAPGLPEGDYRIEVSKPNYVRTTLRIQLAADALSLPVRLIRCGVISGQVGDQQGRPIPTAYVFAIPKPAGGGPLRPAAYGTAGSYSHLDERGRYRLYNLPPGQYAVALSYGASTLAVGSSGSAIVRPGIGSGVLFHPENARPRFFTFSGGEDYRNVDFAIAPAALYSVSGKVDLPAPDTSFWVALTALDQPALSVAVAQAERADGAFRFEGIPPGSYHLFASGPSRARAGRGGILEPDPLYGRMRVEVAGQNVEGISIPVQKGRSASFVLRTAAGCPSSAQITLTSVEDWGVQLETTAEVSAKERTIDSLAPARYYVSLSKTGDACFGATAEMLDLTGTIAPKPVKVAIEPAGSIRGRLAGAAKPADFAVALFASDLTDRGDVQIAYPDAEFRFAFAGLRPGRYRVAAHPVAEGSKARWDPSRMFEIDVPGGAATEMELPVPAVKNP